MPMLTRTDLHLVGDEKIDQDHMVWVDIFSRLEAEVIKPSGIEGHDLQLEILKEILEFSRSHFAYEEEVMAKFAYPDAARHRRMHKDFDQRVYDYYRQVLDGETVLNSEILKMLSTWFKSHTGREDKLAFEYIRQQEMKAIADSD